MFYSFIRKFKAENMKDRGRVNKRISSQLRQTDM